MTITPADILKQLAVAAGYRVHVWGAVENGDEVDSYFWKLAGSCGPDGQSVSTYPSEAEAWRDCCVHNGLLAPIIEEIEHAGWGMLREHGFLACRWVSPDGQLSDERFANLAEAVVGCAIVLASLDDAQEREPNQETAGYN